MHGGFLFVLMGMMVFVQGWAQAETLETRSFTLQYRDARPVLSLVQKRLGPGGSVRIDARGKTLVVMDSSRHIEEIEELLRLYDVPKKTYEVIIKILIGKQDKPQTQQSVELPEVIQKMRSFLKYEYYSELESLYIRIEEGQKALVRGKEYLIQFTPQWFFRYPERVRLKNFVLRKLTSGDALKDWKNLPPLLQTTLNIRTGQPTVIGTAKSRESDTLLLLVLQIQEARKGGS